MVGITPVYGWPYPTSPDSVSDALTDIPQSLAESIEGTIAALYAGGVPGAGWVTPFPWATNWATHSSQQNSRYSKYGSRVYVEAYGTRSVSSFTSGGVVATLPSGYRPNPTGGFPLLRPVLVNSGGTFTLGYAAIATNGQISVTTSAAAAIASGSALLMTFDFPVN